MSGWRVALRIAARDARRARGRSLLVLVLIALPVLAVTGAIVLQRTSDVSTVEGLDRTLGSAQALVQVDDTTDTALVQSPDGSTTGGTDAPLSAPPPTAETLPAAVGGAPVLAMAQSELRVRTSDGVAPAEVLLTDLADPLVVGITRLDSGRLPRDQAEVAVNRALLDEGYAVGDRLRVASDDENDESDSSRGATAGPRIVGVVESTTNRTFPMAFGQPGSLPLPATTNRTFLVGGGPVSWAQVRSLNDRGALVISRAVVLDPPPPSEVPADVRTIDAGLDAQTITALALVVTMALLEVVLLAGPAFAVGARRLQHTLALLAAAGGTPAQARRVVLAGAVVLGVIAAVAGVVLGVLVALALLPLLQRFSASWFGPFEVPVLPVLAVAVFGLVSALLAAVVPAVLASRADVVAVLAGRRGDRAPTYRSPVLGAALLGLGVLLAVVGARGSGTEITIAAGALVSVLGMVLLVPVVVVLVARLGARLPLSLRYAARDAARHRTRTVPAVAAVAATVAGVVALLISTSSDAAENEATYTPSTARGVGVLLATSGLDDDLRARMADLLARDLPDSARVSTVRGVTQPPFDDLDATTTYTAIGRESGGFVEPLLRSYGSSFGSDVLVSDGALPPGLLGLSTADREAVRAALAEGTPVAFTDVDPDAEPQTVPLTYDVTRFANAGAGTEDTTSRVLESRLVHVATPAGPSAVLTPAVAESLDLPVGVVGLVVDGAAVSTDAEEAVGEGAASLSSDVFFSVERGYQADDETVVLQLVLLGLGAVLMLGGTLTATFLALSDARPDLATLAAVGASPRRRRGIAAGYALVVGLVGAVLGALVGAVPGVAISFPLTRAYDDSPGRAAHYLEVPWLPIAVLVVALPLLTAAVVALSSRSKLPLVARVD